MEPNNDYLASEMLAELKRSNERADARLRQKEKHQLIERLIFILCYLITVGAFLWYMYQYDYVSYETTDASGVYTLVDSEGNVIASDLTDEHLEVLYGYCTSDQSQGSEKEIDE